MTERPGLAEWNTGVTQTQESELRDKVNIRGRVVRDDLLNTAKRNIREFL
ncbi:hypothetical protein QWY93_18420 [Echinicola jeungdonensis]|nr:hypothetical protein [Echinicola jeungdonensis]MDN3671278.1 hypothetical protein [Echinicola jeungdonensis]